MTQPQHIGSCGRCPDRNVPVLWCSLCRKFYCNPCYTSHQCTIWGNFEPP